MVLWGLCYFYLGKGGKNRRRGKNENESEKRELVFKEDGQGKCLLLPSSLLIIDEILLHYISLDRNI